MKETKCGMSTEDIIMTLKDAGCSDDRIKAVLDELKSGRKCCKCKSLASHRKELLDKLHEAEQELECLDYLVFSLKSMSTE